MGAFHIDSDFVPDAPSTEKRKPGRPKGAKNKLKSTTSSSDPAALRRGRPPRTGPKQKALAARLAAGEPEQLPEPTRPVGRPPKLASAGPVQVTIREPGQRIFVKGVPDPTRRRHLAEAAELVAKTNLGPVLNASTAVEARVHISMLPSTPSRTSTSTAQSSRKTQQIIPEVNPAANITVEDEDEHSDLLPAGLGEEDDGNDPDEHGVFDNMDPSTQPVNSDGDPVAPKPRRTARALPEWLQDQFDARVVESKTRGDDNLPPLYRDHHAFWFPEADPFFLMRKVNSNFTPQRFYRARFFLWDPAALVDIPCPNCGHQLH
ncbi:hypothetical protein B0H16DRAFT_1467469 [Mycena metata]|uniref:Uncharacterized protein n=1 Tax=Mycena metata TaxID=1033252 RepID=A0AAD7I5K3_9AGAR|nr:hypothetical protein B0H16DRAFT_1467469 [Mycena metata]